MPNLALTPDELLTTTRSVRKRLDLTRPVERAVIEECLAIAQQAPTGSNRQNWRFVVVTNAAKRATLGTLYRQGWEAYRASGGGAGNTTFDDPARNATQQRVASSSRYLADHMGEVPVLVLPCIAERTENQSVQGQAGTWGSIVQAGWSFMLAARARGLGSVWTTLHLRHEREAAELLGIDYEREMQAALIPVAYTLGTDFKPAPREPLSTFVRWVD